MSQAELRELAARLSQAAQLVPDASDYERAGVLVAQLADRLPSMPADEAERLELNADLPQLSFHLGEELARADSLDREALAGSLAFMRRHLVRIEAEWVDRVHLAADPLDRELVTGLARLTRATYERRFAHHYAAAGYRRPWVDKLYRDYSLSGIPDGLLVTLAGIAAGDAHDAVVCVLKGGLPYAILIELLGAAVPVHHVMCGRADGSHTTSEYVVRPIDFDWAELSGRRVVVVDNNAATGATLAHLAQRLGEVPGLRSDLFLDYLVTGLGALDGQTLKAQGYRELLVGPFPERVADRKLKRQLVRAVAQSLRPAEGLA